MSKVTLNAVTLDMLEKAGRYELKVNSKASIEVGEINFEKNVEKKYNIKGDKIVGKIEVIENGSKIPVAMVDENKMKEEKKEKSIEEILNSENDMLF